MHAEPRDESPPPLSQRLHHAADQLPRREVPLSYVLDAHGHQASASVILVMAGLCLVPIPGIGTALGMALLTLSLQQAAFQRTARVLPARLASMSISSPWADRVLRRMARVYAWHEGFMRQRMQLVADLWSARVAHGFYALMAVVIVLPIPFGNVIPAAAIIVLELGRQARDGLCILLGWLITGGAAAVLIAAASAALSGDM